MRACTTYLTEVKKPSFLVLNFQADKQALQEELTGRLRQKDEKIAVLSSKNEVGGQTYTWLHNYFAWMWKDTNYCTLSIKQPNRLFLPH